MSVVRVNNPISVLHQSSADRRGAVALAGARWTEQQQVGRLVEPCVAGGERHDPRLAEHRHGGEAARQALQLEAVIGKLDKYDLLVLDDLSYVHKDHAETSVLFELIGTRYERRLDAEHRQSALRRLE